MVHSYSIVYLLKSITTKWFAGSIDLSTLVYIYEFMNDMGQVSVFIYVFFSLLSQYNWYNVNSGVKH